MHCSVPEGPLGALSATDQRRRQAQRHHCRLAGIGNPPPTAQTPAASLDGTVVAIFTTGLLRQLLSRLTRASLTINIPTGSWKPEQMRSSGYAKQTASTSRDPVNESRGGQTPWADFIKPHTLPAFKWRGGANLAEGSISTAHWRAATSTYQSPDGLKKILLLDGTPVTRSWKNLAGRAGSVSSIHILTAEKIAR